MFYQVGAIQHNSYSALVKKVKFQISNGKRSLEFIIASKLVMNLAVQINILTVNFLLVVVIDLLDLCDLL
jgi:hypothetical protein